MAVRDRDGVPAEVPVVEPTLDSEAWIRDVEAERLERQAEARAERDAAGLEETTGEVATDG